MLLCKGKNFKANHNSVKKVSPSRMMFVIMQRRILKQITTVKKAEAARYGCLLLCKGKNFKANHNPSRCHNCHPSDVCYYAKVRILKQITTMRYLRHLFVRCLLLCKGRILKQITTVKKAEAARYGCLLLCKGKNFKANHNGQALCLRLHVMFVIMQR